MFVFGMMCFTSSRPTQAQQPGVFDIRFTIAYLDPADETVENRETLEKALVETRNRWITVITGYQSGIAIAGVDIPVFVVNEALDSPGASRTTGETIVVDQGFTFHTKTDNASYGEVGIDLDYLETAVDARILNTLIHEVGHVLAFNPTLDAPNNVYADDGNGGTDSTKYTGANGLQAFQNEFDANAEFIPINDGIIGIGHWDYDVSNPNDQFNRPLRDDIMSAPTTVRSFFSQTTVWALRDFGYTTRLPSDFNDDNNVDADDLDFYQGKIGQPAFVDTKLDLDQDGMITLDDRNYLIKNFIPTPLGTGTFPGDINLDGKVNVLGDAFILVGNLGLAGGYADGDLNGDGIVNVLGDAFILVGNLNMSNDPNADQLPDELSN
jgi:hypothetical protein